jgi:hypothetical protein
VPVHFRLDAGQNLVPEVHIRTDFRRVFACLEFPQFFPQVWKTLGRDQTRIAKAAAGSSGKDGDCSTLAEGLTLFENVR